MRVLGYSVVLVLSGIYLPFGVFAIVTYAVRHHTFDFFSVHQLIGHVSHTQFFEPF
jgi:hypothetical protein